MRRRRRRRQSGAIGAAPMPPPLPSSLLLPYSTVLQCSEAVYTEALLYVVAKQAAYPTPTNSLQDSRTAAAAMRRRVAALGGARRRIAHVACGVASTFLAVAQCLHLNTTLSARPSPRRRVWRHAAVAPSCAPPATRA